MQVSEDQILKAIYLFLLILNKGVIHGMSIHGTTVGPDYFRKTGRCESNGLLI